MNQANVTNIILFSAAMGVVLQVALTIMIISHIKGLDVCMVLTSMFSVYQVTKNANCNMNVNSQLSIMIS